MAEVVVPEPQDPVVRGPLPDDRPPRPLERLRHRLAARAVLAVAPEPESWLDVGCGRGHFCEAARRYFPYTAFDGLDVTPLVEVARAAGRIEEAHRGLPGDPEVVSRLTSRYDVISLRGVRPGPDRLRALRPILREDGHLLVDAVPDPATALAALTAAGYHALPPRHRLPGVPLLARLPARPAPR
ncbi:methyltransferase domain-containing protein [Streptomyces abyssomicinicus]|uniref:methyltransferase domain-containing protein n=1 Tax=Streptomyces abyssomicinicus TaxID=574929 RepID=UPI00124FE460|nr:methyltransferase domain-containing protein [Streptomyces abyssomicinicus]